MTREQLTSLLEGITGRINATSPAQEKNLEQARQKIALSFLQDDTPDVGANFLFADSDFYAAENIQQPVRSRIVESATKALREHEAATEASPDQRVFIRSTPVRDLQLAGSVPDWAAGATPAETYGPFLTDEGREIWVDVYKVVKLVVLYQNNLPVLLFKASFQTGRVPVISPSSLAQQYTIVAGSVWINARLLVPGAPPDKFTGLKVSGGTIKLSAKTVLQNNQVTIPANATMDVSLNLLPADNTPAAAPSTYGLDARNATYTMPATWTFSCKNNTCEVRETGPASCSVYGTDMTFTYLPATPIAFNAALNYILVPWTNNVSEFEVKSVKSPFFQPQGKAAILNSYWTLPVAALDINNPVEVSGNGGLIIECGEGLSATWQSLQHGEAMLRKPFIHGLPGALGIMDMASDTLGASSRYTLWQEGESSHASYADIRFLKTVPLVFIINGGAGQEFLSIQCDADIRADRPVKVSGAPFDIKSSFSALMLGASDARRLVYLVDDNILWDNKKPNDKNPIIKPAAIALENALFTVSPVTGILFFGECDESWTKVTRANLFLLFGLYRYLPTLPDPYVGKLKMWDRLFAAGIGGTRTGTTTTGTTAAGTTAAGTSAAGTTAAGTTAAGTPNPVLLLICAVRYSQGAEGKDLVNTSFHFGSLPPGGFTELPEHETGDQTDVPGDTTGRTPPDPTPGRSPGLTRPGSIGTTLDTTRGNAGTGLTRAGGGLSSGTTRAGTASGTTATEANSGGLIRRSVKASLSSFRQLGGLRTAVKIGRPSDVPTAVELSPFRKIFTPEIATPAVPQLPQPEPVLSTTVTGEQLKGEIAKTLKGYTYENFWNNSVGGHRLHNDIFALLDVSSNANQMGISLNGNMMIIQTGRVVSDNDGSAVVRNNSVFPFIVEGMEVKSPGTLVRSFTLPQTAWEPVVNLTPPDREDPLDLSLPKLPMDPERGNLYFPDDGGPTHIWNNNSKPVSLAPIPVIESLLDDFTNNPANYTVSSFTLPFGLKAISYISRNFVEPTKPDIKNLRPKFRKNADGSHKLEGGIQLSFTAGDFGKPVPTPEEKDSPMFPGYVFQLNNLLNLTGVTTNESNLGHRVTEIFNNEFLIGVLSLSNKIKDSRGVPLSRIDLTGYGSNIFSRWLSPTAAMAQTSQARFDVMMGRTGHEVIQVKSILYPWGIRVVRTITLFRSPNGYVYRVDSGWKAESDGLFDFSYRYLKFGKDPYSPNLTDADFQTVNEPYEFHPGVIKGLFNVRNIRDAASVTEYESWNFIAPNEIYVNGIKGQEYKNETGSDIEEPVKCGGVYFDADVEIENVVQGHVNKRVVSKKILGYVQVAPAGKPLSAVQLRELLALQDNSIGGDVDCTVDINKSDQQMRLNRFDVSASVDKNNLPVFVVAARGSVVLPKDGSWAVVQHNAGSGEVTPLPANLSVPLIRTGKWKKNVVIDPSVVQNALARIAHPLEILRDPGNGTINFGYLQSTATQKALFLTPSYGLNKKMLLSKTPPVFADAYRLMTGKSIFPNIGNAINNFGKAMPLLNGKDSAGNTATAFVTNALKDGNTNVLELLQVEAVKAGEAVVEQGMSLLQKGANGVLDKALKFDVPPFEIPLVETTGLRIYIEYKTGKKEQDASEYVDSKLNFDVNSFAGDMTEQWKSRMNNLAMVVDLGDMKRLMTIKGNFSANKGKETGYEGGEDSGVNGLPVPEIEFSDALQPVIDILQILAQLSTGNYAEAMKKGLKIAMSNSGEIWEYKFEASKDIPIVRFPPVESVYNSPQTPLKLEASMGLGVYFNAALKVTTEPGQLLPTAGAFLKFHGGLSVMCMSVGVGSIYAVGSVDVQVACDTKVGPSLALAFGFGVQIVVGLPVVGNASVTYMVGVEMYADKDKVIVAAMMLFRGHAELLGGLVGVTITIEAKGIIERSGGETECSAQVTFALDISIFLVIDISFSKTWGEDRQIA